MIYMGLSFSWTLILLPISILGIILLAHGFSLMLCIIVVFVRDMNMVVDIGLRALFFLSGVFYSATYIPSKYLDYHLMNPVATYIEICRGAVLGDLSIITPFVILRAVVITLLVFALGSAIFNRYQNRAVIHL
jgi:ABC-type polysaccharide/polyol phosphate export permease